MNHVRSLGFTWLVIMLLGCGGQGVPSQSPLSVSPTPSASTPVSASLSPTAASPSPSRSPLVPSPSPTATASAPTTPSAVPPTPPPSQTGTGPGWREIGGFEWDAFIVGAHGFDSGYIVALEDRNGAAYWFSADGAQWQAGSLAQQVQNCAGDPTPDSYASGASGTFDQAVVYGGLLAFTPQSCANPDAGFGAGVAIWISSDGQGWSRSNPFAHRHAVIGDVWPLPGGGWEASVSSFDLPTSIWRSDTGEDWVQTATFPGQLGEGSRADIAADGTRLLAGRLQSGQAALMSSPDGVTWTPLPSQPPLADDESVADVLAASGGLDGWLVITTTDTGSVLWTSPDLAAWQRHVFPNERVVTSAIGYGADYVASAERADLHNTACDGLGCPGPAERQYLSNATFDWHEIEPRQRAGLVFANGPAGLIGIDRFDGTVWLLEP